MTNLISVVLCDDEPLARDRLARLLSCIPEVTLVAQAEHGVALLEAIEQHKPDLVLTDISMPMMDGMAAAERIADMDNPPALVFCTAYDEYAIQAFKVNAIGYLLKPIRQEALNEVIVQASKVNQAQLLSLREQIGSEQSDREELARESISVKTHRGVELISIDDIRYFKADHKYVTVRYSRGEVLADETLKELEEELAGRFVRVHRNALVALAYLEAVEIVGSGYQVRLKGVEERIVISRRHVSELKKRLQQM